MKIKWMDERGATVQTRAPATSSIWANSEAIDCIPPQGQPIRLCMELILDSCFHLFLYTLYVTECTVEGRS